jgi:hypothetical protein
MIHSRTKPSNKLLLFSLFGIALWFFGNLYEAVVIAPNMLKDSARKVQDWQAFFSATNPVFFYIPIAPMAVVVMIVLYFKTSKVQSILKRHLRLATLFGVPAFALGVLMITQINLKLFFGEAGKYAAEAHRLAVLWNMLNVVRIALLSVTLYQMFRAYIETQREG